MSRATLLVVDDNEVVLKIAKEQLEDAGFSVVTTMSPLRINPAIREHNPDLILLDVHMPILSGRRTAEILRQYKISKDIPILLLSSADDDELEKISQEFGLEGFVRKSDLGNDLVESIERALSLRE